MPDPIPSTGDLIRPATARGPLVLPPARAAASASKPAKISFPVAVLRGLARRWRTAAVLGVVLAAAIGTAVWFLVPPPLPTAAARLFIPLKAVGKIGDHPDPPLERSTQLEWIRSRMILNTAIRDSEVANLPVIKEQEDPLDWLVKKIKPEYLGPEILQVSLTYGDPEQARLIVNAVTAAYLERVANKSGTDRADRLKVLSDYATEHKESLKRAREMIRSLDRNGGLDDSEKKTFVKNQLKIQQADSLRRLIAVENDLKAGRIKEKMASAEPKVAFTEDQLNLQADSDPSVRKLAGGLKQAEETYERNYSIAASPKLEQEAVKTAAARVATLKKDHEAARARVRTEVQTAALAQMKAEAATQLQAIRTANAVLEEQLKSYKSEQDVYTQTLSDIQLWDRELAPIQFEVSLTEKLLGGILQAHQMLKVEQNAPSRVELMEQATITRVDAAKRKMTLAAGGAATGLLLACLLVGLLEYRLHRVESAAVVSQFLGLRLVGTVPTPKAGPLRWFANSDAKTTAVLTEAIANTRTMLLHGEGSADHRVLLITSSVSGEGKTSLSVQLGVSIALAGHKTILIDGDLRKPSVHERLGMSNGPGVCELLRGEVSLFEVVRETTVPGLHMISAGQWTTGTSQALVTAPLSQLFAAWREQYEFVIFDSSPVLPVTDALLLARHVDGVILSLLQGVSRVSQASETCERFTSLGVNVIGAIVNGTPARSYGGSSKYYYQTPTTNTPSTEQA